MADAEIIPLGARGRPGRGTGTKRPSESSRALVPGQPKMAPAKRSTPPAEEPESAEPQAAPAEPVEPVATSMPHQTAQGGTSWVPVTEIVAALGKSAKEVFGEDADRRLAELLAFLRRRVTGDYSVDEYGLDPELTARFLATAVRPLATKWFRVEVRGIENIPQQGGALVVSNHSGTIPIDGLVTMFAVHEHTGRFLRPLGADLVFRLPFVGEVARKGGATLACNEDATRMLAGGELVGVWPEGFKGIGKPYSERYKLQRFGRGGFVSAAVRTGVPIVPCSVVGAEEIYPLVGNIPALARLLGVPYIPITPFFPLLGPLGLIPLPSKWIIEFGEPILTDDYDTAHADDPMLTFDVTDQVRETIQQTLYSLLMRRKSVFH
jgi:1-acyl-sn-glycerol-3-phosphate acyltransferase